MESGILTLLYVSKATGDRTGLVINGSFPRIFSNAICVKGYGR